MSSRGLHREVTAPQFSRELPRPCWRAQGWVRTLSALCLQLGEDPTLAASYPGGLLADPVGALLAASLESAAPAGPDSRDLVGRLASQVPFSLCSS